jgi:ubiquinone/menaquinone biosynthesis C-methylase UbiE
MPIHSLEAERLSADGFIPLWVINEHVARYEFAARYVEGKIVVDCACGDGRGTIHFLQADAKYIYAFDVSESSVEAARRHCKSESVKFQVSDALQLPLADESADIFISLETIEHIQDDAAYVKEMARVLKPDGLLICSTPNRVLTNPGLDLGDQPFNPFHIREYSTGEFSSLLAKHFSEITLYGQNPKSKVYAKALARVARLIPSKGAARINQMLKLPRFIYYNRAYASVVEIESKIEYEYIVAVCRKPQREFSRAF